MTEININVKLAPSGEKYTVRVDPSITVEEFKRVVSEQSSVPPEQQRLIYKGHVLRDQATLSSYAIAADHTVLLVRGVAKSNTEASGSSAAAPAAAAAPSGSSPQANSGPAPAAAAGGNPFAMFMGGGANANPNANPFGMLGGMDINQMMNPQMIQSMLSNPMVMQMVQQVMSNPAMMEMMINSNPFLRQMVDANPQMREVLANPQMFEAIAQPQNLQAMLQMQQAMAQLRQSPLFGNMAGLGAASAAPQSSAQSVGTRAAGSSSPPPSSAAAQESSQSPQPTQPHSPSQSPQSFQDPLASIMQMMQGLQQPQQQQQQQQSAVAPASPPQQPANEAPAPGPAPAPNPLLAMMQAFQRPASGSQGAQAINPFAMFLANPAAASPPADMRPELIYRTQLATLNDMGFTDPQANLAALMATGGNIEAAVDRLTSGH